MPQPKKPTMTSREAAALLVSGGATDDADEANLMAEGKLLDPDALQRAYFRRIFGFDFEVEIDEKKHKAYARDNDLGLSVTCTWIAGQDDANSQRLAKACIRLKQKHEKAVVIPEGEVV